MKDRWSAPGPILALVLLNLFSFCPDSAGMGFYLDDWSLAEPAWRAAGGGLWGMMREFHRAGMSFGTSWFLRPMDILYHPGMYWLAGLTFWKYQAAYRLMESVSATLLFLTFRAATGREGLAFLAAVLFTVFPNHGATHHWFTAVATPAMALASAGLWCYGRWLEGGSRAFLAAGLALLAAGSLTYEAVLPMVVLMPFLGYWHGLRRGRTPAEAGAKALRDCLWPGVAAVLLAGYHVGIQRWGPATISRRMAFHPGFALKALTKGLECNTTGVVHLCWVFLGRALSGLAWWRWLAAALGAAVLAAWTRSRFPGDPSGEIPGTRSWLAASAVFLLASYAPYAMSAVGYLPHIFDPQNRLNVPPSLAAAMALAMGLSLLPGRVRPWTLAGLLAVFTVVNWENARQWKGAYAAQRDVLSALKKHLDALPPEATVVALEDAPKVFGWAPVFNETFAFDPSLRLFTGRKDLQGTLVVGGLAERTYPEVKARYRYLYPEDRLIVWEPGTLGLPP